jgi:hypothetical protein
MFIVENIYGEDDICQIILIEVTTKIKITKKGI